MSQGAVTGSRVVHKLHWYINRLSRMSPGEVLYRARGFARGGWERLALALGAPRVAPYVHESGFRPWMHRVSVTTAAPYLAAADRILRGEFRVFALAPAQLGVPVQWNRDPLTGIQAPLEFGKNLDYRDEQRVGNIKYLWEPNRHLQMVTLVQAYVLSGDARYLDGFVTQMQSWFEQCPYPYGPNWTSSLELGIRLINWSICWQLLDSVSWSSERPDLEPFRRQWTDSVYFHCRYIAGHWSRYSSANNHLIGEAAGLYVAACTWDYWQANAAWRRRAKAILEAEAGKQTHADGVNREQAISYQQFVLDFLLIAALYGRQQGDDFAPAFWDVMQSMLGFIRAAMDVGGNLPMIGDADDGFVVRLGPAADDAVYRSLLASGALLFGRSDLKRKAGALDDKTRWLLDGVRLDGGGTDPDTAWGLMEPGDLDDGDKGEFPDGGYYFLGSEFGTPREVVCMLDAGPLGYLSIAAHGHADALALWLSAGGHEIFIDPGTYSYHTQKKWRDYFRGTRAHNTVTVDDEDQSLSGGNFMWLRHAGASCDEYRDDGRVQVWHGRHTGYMRLDDPVLHERRVELDRAARTISVTDRLSCRGEHSVERCWHLAEGCSVSQVGQAFEIRNGPSRVVLEEFAGPDGEVNRLHGSDEPPLGWVSRSFDIKVPTTTIVRRERISGSTTLKAVIRLGS